MPPSKTTRRYRWQFSLRAVLVATAVISALFATPPRHARFGRRGADCVLRVRFLAAGDWLPFTRDLRTAAQMSVSIHRRRWQISLRSMIAATAVIALLLAIPKFLLGVAALLMGALGALLVFYVLVYLPVAIGCGLLSTLKQSAKAGPLVPSELVTPPAPSADRVASR